MDMTPILKIFRMAAGEFANVDDELVGEWIELTRPLVSKKRFRHLWTQALAFLTAHRMKMSGVGIAPGDDPMADINNIGVGTFMRIGNYSEGEVSVGFNGNITQFTDSDAEYALTPYGVQFLRLRRMIMSITSAGEARGWT